MGEKSGLIHSLARTTACSTVRTSSRVTPIFIRAMMKLHFKEQSDPIGPNQTSLACDEDQELKSCRRVPPSSEVIEEPLKPGSWASVHDRSAKLKSLGGWKGTCDGSEDPSAMRQPVSRDGREDPREPHNHCRGRDCHSHCSNQGCSEVGRRQGI